MKVGKVWDLLAVNKNPLACRTRAGVWMALSQTEKVS